MDTTNDMDGEHWYAVRCILHLPELPAYEERITLWRATAFDHAISLAEAEVAEQVEILSPSVVYTGLAQAFRLFDEPASGAEVFSLIRESRLEPADYLSAFFDTGTERQADVSES
jgi:hypothetical protein